MDAKQKLRSYLPAHRYARLCARELDALIETTIQSPKIDGMPRRLGTNGLEYEVARIEIAKDKLTRAREKALAILDEIEDMIDSLDDFDEKRMLRLHYIGGLTWDQVAVESHWSESTVRRIHGRALEELRRKK